MSPYTLLVSLHVAVAIFGVGQLSAIARAARNARRSQLPAADPLEQSLRLTRYALIAMLVTGALLDALVGGSYHASMWFRASVGLSILTGIALARALAALRRARGSSEPAPALAGVERWSWAACALVATITVLMETKPG